MRRPPVRAMLLALSMTFAPPVVPPVTAEVAVFPPAPDMPDGPVPDAVDRALRGVLALSLEQDAWAPNDPSFAAVAASGDARIAWLMADLVRFAWHPDFADAVMDAAAALMGVPLAGPDRRRDLVDTLIAWDLPATPGYLARKRAIHTAYLPGLDDLFVPGLDWRMVGWGGVRIDDRPPFATDAPCDCIPAADDPAVETVAEAAWLEADDVVFGVVVNGAARAYPRRIMEVREMVNDTLGGRDLALPYCTLCGAAQAFFTDRLPEGVARPILRTSGLLIRSNKVSYDVVTGSVFDTFTGAAKTGPLAEAGVVLPQASVVTTTWGRWTSAHPGTTVLVEALALGRDFDLRNTRDARGPIFPVGDVDPRLPVQEDVVGVVLPDGRAVAFAVAPAAAALAQGRDVTLDGVRLVGEGGGLRAVDAAGADLGSHPAFWFAWSQFHPGTALWPADGR